MIQSMTGFASKTVILATGDNSSNNGSNVSNSSSITISLKSVNARFFEINFRIPYQLSNWETELDKLLKKKLYRGSVQVHIHVADPTIFKDEVRPMLQVIHGYREAMKTIVAECGLGKEEVRLDHLLQMPNIFIAEDRFIDARFKADFFEQFVSVIDKMVEAREQEGAALLIDMQQRIAVMTEEMSHVEALATGLIERQKAKVVSAMQEFEGQENALADTRKNALFAYLDKIDIHEEIVRFKSHIESLTKQFGAVGVEKGKKLDFTLQELGREINTITAKCSDAEMSLHAINIKVNIEKVREQVQNIV